MNVNRWLVLFASLVINLCIGSAYAWSVFQRPLISLFQWSTSEASLAFTLSLSLVPLAMIVAGKVQDQKGPKFVIFTGGIIFGAGIIGAGFTQSLTHIYLTYGVLGGIGIGVIYACTVANTVKWFPDKRGLASGLVVAGFGSGAVLLAPVAAGLIQSYGVLASFQYLGVAYLVTICLAVQFVHVAPAGYRPPGWTPPAPAANSNSLDTGVDKGWKEMLADPMFYVLWCMYTIGTISGLMIIGHAAPIGQELVKLTPQAAALALSFLALSNGIGRIAWGWISDKIGRYPACMAMYVIIGVTMFMIGGASSFGSFVAALMAIGLCFGGFMGIFPSITADMFGSKNLGMNYGIIFTAYGTAAFIGPRLAARIKEINSGDYTQAFLIAAGLSIGGVLLTLIAQYRRKRVQAPVTA
ncbi:MAG: OFA family MFS transporter [Negativicutes bacterium]|nr:OFA family MFS transporter [Negativicutes bacterium]